MENSQIFLSVVCVFRNKGKYLDGILENASKVMATLVRDYEIIIIDNASDDESLNLLKKITGKNGIPNLQVYALTREVDTDVAFWVGLENALGDYVVAMDPLSDEIDFLSAMLKEAINGADVVFANNRQKQKQSFMYRGACSVFNAFYKIFNGIHLTKEAPQYRLLSRRVVNFILQHPQPALTYRYLPATGGFARVNLDYNAEPRVVNMKSLSDSIERGIRLLVSTTRTPMRFVTSLSLFGALINLLYSAYVVAIGVFKDDVAPGWVSLSLQLSGMFFLISLVLLVLGEYILHVISFSTEGPLCHISQEFTSARITHREKLNIEDNILQRSMTNA